MQFSFKASIFQFGLIPSRTYAISTSRNKQSLCHLNKTLIHITKNPYVWQNWRIGITLVLFRLCIKYIFSWMLFIYEICHNSNNNWPCYYNHIGKSLQAYCTKSICCLMDLLLSRQFSQPTHSFQYSHHRNGFSKINL